MVREPEDYFNPEESSDLSRYAKEAEKIKVVKDNDWNVTAKSKKPEKPRKPRKHAKPILNLKSLKIPKVKIPSYLTKTQIALAIAITLILTGGGYAASTLPVKHCKH